MNFFDISTGVPNNWEWTFESGTPAYSTEQNPVVYYQETGTFDVSLTVSNSIDTSTLILEDYITVASLPETPGTPTGEIEICTNWTDTTSYSTSGSPNAESYFWEISPPDAGTISGNGLTGTVNWTENWEGTATIKVKGYNEICGEGEFSEELNVDCSICTGIKEGESLSKIMVYPNPAKNNITIARSTKLKGQTIITIFNLTNKQIVHQKFHNQQLIELDVGSLAKGIYLLKIQTIEKTDIRKLLIQ